MISDTHGLLRPQAVAALEGSDLIVHTGDVGCPDVLERRGGVLYLNPRGAGHRRFGLAPILIRLEVEDGELRPELVRLEE